MERQTITGTLSTSGRLSGALSVGGGTTDYNELENKPTYNGHVIEGDLTSESLGIWQPKNFSTEEQNTGLKWIDGKDIYYKTFNVTLNANTITIPETTDIDKIILIIGFVNVQSENIVYNLPYADSNDYISFGVTTHGIQIYLSDWFKTKTPNARPTFFYTKN